MISTALLTSATPVLYRHTRTYITTSYEVIPRPVFYDTHLGQMQYRTVCCMQHDDAQPMNWRNTACATTSCRPFNTLGETYVCECVHTAVIFLPVRPVMTNQVTALLISRILSIHIVANNIIAYCIVRGVLHKNIKKTLLLLSNNKWWTRPVVFIVGTLAVRGTCDTSGRLFIELPFQSTYYKQLQINPQLQIDPQYAEHPCYSATAVLYFRQLSCKY